jgi:GDPmannose 4,6-dehydratase
MKAIIFGVTGQDGSYLAELLLEKGYEVVGVCRRSSVNNAERIKHLLNIEGFDTVVGDVTDVSSITGIFQAHPDVNEIYNLAAQSHVGVSFSQPGATWDITGKGCLNILQSIVDAELDARFYQASSSEMFGDSYDVRLPKDENGEVYKDKYQDELTRFTPQSPYAVAKVAAHQSVRLYREAYGLHASCGILFNHESPRRGENFVTRKITKWIGDFVEWLSNNEISVHDLSKKCLESNAETLFCSGEAYSFPKLRLGNLDAFRDWGFAGDYVEAMWLMLQQHEPADFVVCTGETHSVREFLEIAFDHAGLEHWSPYVFIDPEFYRPAEVDYLRGDNFKARNLLNWKPNHSFNDLVTMMVDHDVDNSSSLDYEHVYNSTLQQIGDLVHRK